MRHVKMLKLEKIVLVTAWQMLIWMAFAMRMIYALTWLHAILMTRII